ncbi:transposase InsO family protein [Paraburkholderia sp. HC6.4b]|nr:transposase InsO family protein [Paraburkholderia sp. HC6.4b]MBB5449899.1 transposase InsO family protein [Paraburkholderia sp. Kb1A]
MIGLEDRQRLAREIESANRAGARLRLACEVAGIDVRTLQRWKAHQGLVKGDARPGAMRPLPAHTLSPQERANVLRVANEPRFADMPPARIVPMLADEGVYIASESTFARVLREHGQMTRRGRARTPSSARPPTTHVATAPRQVWCWDMTFLPATVTGRWFHLYLILDLYSRKIVGWEVHDSDAAEHAAHLVRRTALSEGIAVLETRPVLHGDNGATLKATTVLAMLHWLGVKPSYSRPRVSDDNAYAEALFRTAKYRPEFPVTGFEDLNAARNWAAGFVQWYNFEHRHSGIRYVTPAQRHAGDDRALLAARHALYVQTRLSLKSPGITAITMHVINAHRRTLDLRRKHAPRTVSVKEEINCQRACWPQCLDAHIASLTRGHATKPGYPNRHRRSRPKPFFDHQTQRPVRHTHRLLLQLRSP